MTKKEQALQNASEILRMAITVFSDNHILAVLATTQALHESNPQLTSRLSKEGNNLFGIKSKTGTPYQTVEYNNGKKGNEIARFAHYKTRLDSIYDYKRVLENDRYNKVRSAKTVESAIIAMGQSGYATDPKYANYLLAIYKTYVKPILK